MKQLFLQMLAVAAVVSVVLAVLLIPARKWLERRYAPQVRWSLWRGIAFVLILGIGGFSVFRMVPAVLVVRLPDRTFGVPVSQEEVRRSEDAGRQGSAELPENMMSPEDAGLSGNAMNPNNAELQGNAMSSGNAGSSEDVKYPAANDMNLGSDVESDLTAGLDNLSTPMTGNTGGLRVSLLELLGWLWLAVALSLVLRQTFVCLLTRRRMFRASVPAEPADAWQSENERVRFRILPGLETPMTLGWIRPIIFLPQEDTAAMAVLHEVTHVRRRDILYKNVIFIACALYWFDPLVWLMAKAADRDMEAACDAEVVKSCTSEERRAYGELLITAAAGGKAVPFATRFGNGTEEMRFRLAQLMKPGKRSRALVCVLLAVVLSLMSFVACVGSDAEEEAKSEPQPTEVSEAHDEPQPTEAADVKDEPKPAVQPAGKGEAKPVDETVYIIPTPVSDIDMAARKAFAQILRQMREEQLLPNGRRGERWSGNTEMGDNWFSVADVDGDGKEELLIRYTRGREENHRGWVIGYDEGRGKTYVQLETLPFMDFYPNGILKVSSSEEQQGTALSDTFYRYLPGSDSYEVLDDVPPADAAEYDAWLARYIGGMTAFTLFYTAVDSPYNIAMLAGEDMPLCVVCGRDGKVIPMEELKDMAVGTRGFGRCFGSFTFDEVRQDGEEWYRLKHEDGEVTLRVNGMETLLIAERGRGASLRRVTADIPCFLPGSGAVNTYIYLADVTGDGAKDLIYTYSTGGVGFYEVFCCVLDFEALQTYYVSDLTGGEVLAKMLSTVEVKGIAVGEELQGNGDTLNYALCAARQGDGAWAGAKAYLLDNVRAYDCDLSIDVRTLDWYNLRVEEDVLQAEVAFNVKSGFIGSYAFDLRCDLRWDAKTRTFEPDPDSYIFKINDPAELPEGWSR